ncbi:oxidoreductase [Pseudomonas matsuisoli]|uniref:N-methylproline demethylase n=1 Tax=Pseudomonas matsuisoli TaxID=1515666 RepID=A0A917V1I7_9PSED|nr:FAD-dependent oxidoreductase [Pseudomonas matsuisoli]GGK09026.1 N-methylproline demethylase [Pseudomonas matsuisoli]
MNVIATSSARKDPLLQPLQIKHLTLRNRIMSTSHACGLEEGGMPKEAYQLYHTEKAKGGLALSMFGGSSNVDRDSPNIFRQLNVGVDAIIPHLQQFSERMHAQGAALMCQITHLGRRGDPFAGDRLTTIAPSVVRETLHRSIPKAMDEYDIGRVVKAYAAAALRCKEGGLDGIETLAGGHLIGQFFSALTNRRTDRFGGSLENRCRFALEVHEAIRKAVGDGFLVGIRLSVDEGVSGGLTFEDCVAIGQILQREGAVDFFNAVYGNMDTIRSLVVENMPGIGAPIAPWVDAIGRFKHEVKLPVFHAARMADVASARYAVSEGKIDMAAMTRAQIADPYLVEKIIAGKELEIRPCIGASYCQSAQRPSCLHNPATGREGSLPQKLVKTDGPLKRVVVVGGGPGGLEAARVAAERGHEVVLHEAASQLGGQVLLGAIGSWRRDLISVIDWRVAELERLGVRVHTDSYMEYAELAGLQADVVIIATGGLPNVDLLEGAELCATSWDVVSGHLTPAAGAKALVFDGTGRHPAPLAAEKIREQGADVVYFSIDGQIAEEGTYSERYRWKKRFLELGITPVFESKLVAVERVGTRLRATVVNEINATEHHLEVDHVIVDQGTIPMDELYTELRSDSVNKGVTDIEALVATRAQPFASEAGMALYRIGDAVSSRNVNTALLDAYRISCVL